MPKSEETVPGSWQPGIAVDARGGTVIDPTQNVRELVLAESRRQDGMRDALKELLNVKVDSVKDVANVIQQGVAAYQNALREAETRRIDELARTRQEFQNTIKDMLAESVRSTSKLVSDQLLQIQATFDVRVSRLEAGAFTAAGKASVADPAFADALTRVTGELRQMKINQETMAASQSTGGGVTQGHADADARMWKMIAAFGTLAGIVIAYLAAKGGHVP